MWNNLEVLFYLRYKNKVAWQKSLCTRFTVTFAIAKVSKNTRIIRKCSSYMLKYIISYCNKSSGVDKFSDILTHVWPLEKKTWHKMWTLIGLNGLRYSYRNNNFDKSLNGGLCINVPKRYSFRKSREHSLWQRSYTSYQHLSEWDCLERARRTFLIGFTYHLTNMARIAETSFHNLR